MDQRTARALVVAAAAALVSPEVRADEGQIEPYARIIVDSTAIRSGPGASFRRVFQAHRGDVYPVHKRSTLGYWFQIELPDGTHGWIYGDAVYVHEVSDQKGTGGRFLPEVFAPPPLPEATAEIAMTFGVLGQGGFMALRPTFLIQPTFGVEATAGATVSRGGRLLLGAAGGIVNLFPDSPIVPYFAVGGGIVYSDPNADTFLLESGSLGALYGGGGLRFSFRYRLTLRIEARAYAFFEPDRYKSLEEYSGGLTVFF